MANFLSLLYASSIVKNEGLCERAIPLYLTNFVLLIEVLKMHVQVNKIYVTIDLREGEHERDLV